MLRTGFEPATDNRNRSGPQQNVVAVVRVQSVAESNRFCQIIGSLRPATIFPSSRPARVRTRTGEVGARRAPAYTTGPRERTTRIEQASPGWKPGALPSELRPRSGTPGWNRTSVLSRRRAALLSTELRAFCRSLRQESNPHLGRTKGACLPFTLRRLEVESDTNQALVT